jgi:hypothetical protein
MLPSISILTYFNWPSNLLPIYFGKGTLFTSNNVLSEQKGRHRRQAAHCRDASGRARTPLGSLDPNSLSGKLRQYRNFLSN